MKIKTYLDKVALGDPQLYENMGLIPIVGGKKSNLEYLLLQDCIPKETVQVKDTGDVNRLTLVNNTDKDVLVIKGEYVVGGKQNRMITVNALLKPGKTDVPCHCVQRGRWTPGGEMRKFDTGSMMPASSRSPVMKCFSGSRGQSATWRGIDCLFAAADMESESRTSDFDEIYEGKKQDLQDYVDKFSLVEGQIGAIVKVGGNYFIDMFDKPATLKAHYERLLTSYAIDAVTDRSGEVISFTNQEAEKFLADVAKAEEHRSKSLDLGEDIELTGPVVGAGLEYKKTLVYLGAKSDGDNDPERGSFRDAIDGIDVDLNNPVHPIRPPRGRRPGRSDDVYGPGSQRRSRRRGSQYRTGNLFLGRSNLF